MGDFLNWGVPVGRFKGIIIRLHFTFILYALYRAQSFGNIGLGLAFIIGLYVCILLHEFGHAFAARWCKGECDEILLWPLGGLAYCRPPFDATAHLITTVAGPFVTLVLWLFFWGLSLIFTHLTPDVAWQNPSFFWFLLAMKELNFWLLIFNMIPAFPMDGGRILRDILWHWVGAITSTKIAIFLSRIVAVAWIGYCIYSDNYWLMIFALFILTQSSHEAQVAADASGTYSFSLKDHLHHGKRRRLFQKAIHEQNMEHATAGFHRCASCNRTENDSPNLDFRVCPECSNAEEYCQEHLKNHKHT